MVAVKISGGWQAARIELGSGVAGVRVAIYVYSTNNHSNTQYNRVLAAETVF